MSKQAQMFERIVHWQHSGLSQKLWCEQNNMAYATFHYWYKRFRSAAIFVPLLIHAPPSSCWRELFATSGTRAQEWSFV